MSVKNGWKLANIQFHVHFRFFYFSIRETHCKFCTFDDECLKLLKNKKDEQKCYKRAKKNTVKNFNTRLNWVLTRGSSSITAKVLFCIQFLRKPENNDVPWMWLKQKNVFVQATKTKLQKFFLQAKRKIVRACQSQTSAQHIRTLTPKTVLKFSWGKQEMF